METVQTDNQPFIDCWNEILTPKWIRFRHLLSGNGKIHSDIAFDYIDIEPGDRVLDIGCGFGENCLELAQRVGPDGEIVGLDCTDAFLEIAERERLAAGADNVRYVLDDIEAADLEPESFDVAFSRFGMMYCDNPVRALRKVSAALVPGGQVHMLVWRSIEDNPCWGDAEQIALDYLPSPEDDASTCGPGPFSMASERLDRQLLELASFENVTLRRIDVDICVGTSLDEAIEYQVQVGPAGFVIREAEEAGRRALPAICHDLTEHYRGFSRADGSVWLPSSTWLVSANKPS